jgi:hypothetical protein
MKLIERQRLSERGRANRSSLNLLKRFRALALIIPLFITSLSCDFIPQGQETEATSTIIPADDILAFQVPVSVLALEPGETIPYTQLTYDSHEGSIYRVLIDHQTAEKRVGDSFRWRGVIAPGVSARYDLRVIPNFNREVLLAGGSVELGVFNPVPVELESEPAAADDLLNFGGIFVDYTVPIDEQVPGTTLFFKGQDEQGAELSGVVGYPYRAVGDSIIWTGSLRDNTTVRYSLRVVSIKEDSLRLMGTADLWINPVQ